MRLFAGSNAIAPEAVPKIPKVGVALAAIVAVTLAEGDAMQAPVDGFVWHSASASGSVAEPVLAVAVIVSPAPTSTVATANAADPCPRSVLEPPGV